MQNQPQQNQKPEQEAEPDTNRQVVKKAVLDQYQLPQKADTAEREVSGAAIVQRFKARREADRQASQRNNPLRPQQGNPLRQRPGNPQ